MHKANLRIPYVFYSPETKSTEIDIRGRSCGLRLPENCYSELRQTALKTLGSQHPSIPDRIFGTKRIDFPRLRNQGRVMNQEVEVLHSPLIAPSLSPSSRTAFLFLFIPNNDGETQAFFTRIFCIKLAPLRCDFPPPKIAICCMHRKRQYKVALTQVPAGIP